MTSINIKYIDRYKEILELKEELDGTSYRFDEIFDKYILSYSKSLFDDINGEIVREIDEEAKEQILFLIDEGFPKFKKAYKNFISLKDIWEDRIKKVFEIDIDIVILFSVGFSSPAKVYKVSSTNLIILSVDKIVNLSMEDNIDILIAHEIAHLAHDKLGGRIFREEYEESINRSCWYLYKEGFASFFEKRLLNGKGQWGPEFDLYCMENYYDIVHEFREDLNEGRNTSHFFGEWGPNYEIGDLAYYFAERYFANLMIKFDIEDIAKFSIDEIRHSVEKFVADVLADKLKHKGSLTLKTPRLVLRRFKISDSNYMFENWASREEVTQYLTWNTHENIEDSKEFIKSALDSYKNADYYMWAITLAGIPIGSISAGNINSQYHYCEIGYCLSDDYWNEGYMSEAVNSLVEFLIEKVHFHRIRAVHIEGNDASGKVMKKVGMTFEGVSREAMLLSSGEYKDLYNYSILEDDWYRIKIEEEERKKFEETMVKVDAYYIPYEDVEEYKRGRKELNDKLNLLFTELGYKTKNDWKGSQDGEAVLAFNDIGELVAIVHLDPDNVKKMKELDNDNFKRWVLESNSL